MSQPEQQVDLTPLQVLMDGDVGRKIGKEWISPDIRRAIEVDLPDGLLCVNLGLDGSYTLDHNFGEKVGTISSDGKTSGQAAEIYNRVLSILGS